VVYLERTSFLYIRHETLFLVAAARLNPNAAMIFEFLLQKLRVLKSYLGNHFNDEDIQSNFTLIYELFDETMDFGYPQLLATENLKQFISGGMLPSTIATQSTGAQLTSQITGTIDWRTQGLKFRNNEVHIQVVETVTLVLSATSQVLRAEILGKIMMTTQLTGMPECKLGLNDKLIMEKEGGASAAAVQSKTSGVDIDDFTFHRFEFKFFLIIYFYYN
jgi:AP-2 complex subunit mu-1